MSSGGAEWVRKVKGRDSDRQMAVKAGIPTGTIGRQMVGDSLTPENVVAIARAYGVSPLDGLVAIGLVSEADVTRATLPDVSDGELVDEVLRRIRQGAHPLLTSPLV
ncbi:MAG: helix-turn-helix domain-containing protein [Propionibacteriaceae bacterium]|nr:helix-turn-helix domain-containing protein [Propionibacteriaceae bacterium]